MTISGSSSCIITMLTPLLFSIMYFSVQSEENMFHVKAFYMYNFP